MPNYEPLAGCHAQGPTRGLGGPEQTQPAKPERGVEEGVGRGEIPSQASRDPTPQTPPSFVGRGVSNGPAIRSDGVSALAVWEGRASTPPPMKNRGRDPCPPPTRC